MSEITILIGTNVISTIHLIISVLGCVSNIRSLFEIDKNILNLRTGNRICELQVNVILRAISWGKGNLLVLCIFEPG
jgi:hypothetical protein